MQVKTQEELFDMLSAMDDNLQYRRLSPIMQNPHYISSEEWYEWTEALDSAFTEIDEQYQTLMGQIREIQRQMFAYYWAQKSEDLLEQLERPF